MLQQCVPAEDEATYQCPKPVMADLWDWMVTCYHDKEAMRVRVETCDQLLFIERARYQDSMNKWYRKWYITIPLGVAAGSLAALLAVTVAGG